MVIAGDLSFFKSLMFRSLTWEEQKSLQLLVNSLLWENCVTDYRPEAIETFLPGFFFNSLINVVKYALGQFVARISRAWFKEQRVRLL